MRLVKLAVERFQCIEQAEVELGPHLNVLYGPNDLGKSSLAWAIRAVLLLQHGSTHAARFASWYDDGEPRVALTLCADDGRYWRVTKVFGGSAGRSTLESSKDGKTFTAEASAREVDKRLRELLRWGLAAPGGAGKQAFPESFLTQVLLADQSQDSVRKVLFAAKLDRDPDESGRARLVEALGALAQDPLFKQVLDEADGKVAQAYTPKGQRKRAAGSPWVASTERIARLRHEQEALAAQAKDSVGVEEKLRSLHRQRDAAQAELEELGERHQIAERALVAKRERDRLGDEVAARDQQLRDVARVQDELATAQARVEELARQLRSGAQAEARTAQAAADAEARRDELGQRLDALAHADPEAEQQEARLQEDVRRAEQGVRDGQARVEAACAAVQAATEVADRLRAIAGEARTASAGVRTAEVAAQVAARALAEAEQRYEAAREQLREVRAADQAEARALRRQALEHQVQALGAQQRELAATRARAQEVGARTAALATAEAAARDATTAVTTAGGAIVAAEAALAKVEASRRTLGQVETYGRFRALRAQVEQARQARVAAEDERRRAVELRQQAEELRRQLRVGLPTADRLAALRRLQGELGLAEARLGGGLSVAVRPRRALELRVVRDGVAAPATSTVAPVTLSAQRSLTLAIDDVLELDVTAGEEAARQQAADLRARWLREGEATLVEHGAPTIEALEDARARSDEAARQIAQLDRDAEVAQARAAAAAAEDLDALAPQLAAAEAELAGADREDLATRLARLGDPWQVGLRKHASELEAGLDGQRARVARAREDAAGAEAKATAQRAAVAALQDQVAQAQAGLAEPWAVTVATSTAAQQAVTDELAEVQRQLDGLATGASRADAVAEAAVAQAQVALEVARAAGERAAGDARTAGDAEIRATTRLEAARAAARAVDVHGAWTQTIDEGGAALSLVTWVEARRAAEQQRAGAEAARVAATSALAAAQHARKTALDQRRHELEAAGVVAREARRQVEAATGAQRERTAASEAAGAVHADLRVAVASVNVAQLRQELADRRARMAALAPAIGDVDEARVAGLARELERQRAALRELDDELAKTKGALEHVGGAIIRERLKDVEHALTHEVDKERALEIELEAWKLLQATLRDTESSESAHLGRALAGPVSASFRQLTGGRYGELDLGAQLEAGGIHVAGELRDLDALSAGTQDQLATLLRVCIAQQLQSAIVLDDHLSQSDATRVAWFNQMLRAAADHVQIVLITCRPAEILAADELAVVDGGGRLAAPARVHAVNLARAIRRFPAARSGGK